MNLSYETAKRLKDAGFPQELSKNRFLLHPVPGEQENECVHYPELFELIEACGVYMTLDGSKETGWSVWQVVPRPDFAPHYTGPTPEEAVAELWLALSTPAKPG